MNATSKANTELAYFKVLAPLAGFAIDSTSIQQSVPPAPDIECRLTNGAPFSAELVALDDPNTRARLTNMENTKLCWYAARDSWPVAEQAIINSLARDLMLSCIFSNDAGQRDRKRVFIEVQRILMSLPSDFAGDMTSTLRKGGAAGKAQSVKVHRGGSTGIRISAPSAGGWQSPTHAALLSKLSHAPYASASPVHLFAYSEHDELGAHVTSLSDLESLVRKLLPSSHLAAVHFFDWWGQGT